MQHSSSAIRLGHVLTWWNAAKFTDREALEKALISAGFGKFTPEKRTAPAALRSALEEVFVGRDHAIEVLKDRNAYEIVQIVRGEQQNEYRRRYRVGIDAARQVDVAPYDYHTAERIVQAFNTHLGLVTANAVTQSLLGILGSLKGNRMRADGGLYGLPESELPRWKQAAEAAESAAARGRGTQVYVVRHDVDADSVRAIKDALVREVQTEAGRIKGEVESGELGKRALETRRTECDELREKIAVYEDLLNTSLAGLHVAVQDADEAAVGAELLLAGGVGAGAEA